MADGAVRVGDTARRPISRPPVFMDALPRLAFRRGAAADLGPVRGLRTGAARPARCAAGFPAPTPGSGSPSASRADKGFPYVRQAAGAGASCVPSLERTPRGARSRHTRTRTSEHRGGGSTLLFEPKPAGRQGTRECDGPVRAVDGGVRPLLAAAPGLRCLNRGPAAPAATPCVEPQTDRRPSSGDRHRVRQWCPAEGARSGTRDQRLEHPTPGRDRATPG